MLNISVYIYCVACCSCLSQLSLLVLLYFLYFSVFLLLLEYVKLDNSFCYQVLVEVCMFLINFIFIILSMLVRILYFCCIYRKKSWCYHASQFILALTNSYCNFHILFIYYVLYISLCASTLYFPCLPFIFIDCI